jgi:hypothetical protein
MLDKKYVSYLARLHIITDHVKPITNNSNKIHKHALD